MCQDDKIALVRQLANFIRANCRAAVLLVLYAPKLVEAIKFLARMSICLYVDRLAPHVTTDRQNSRLLLCVVRLLHSGNVILWLSANHANRRRKRRTRRDPMAATEKRQDRSQWVTEKCRAKTRGNPKTMQFRMVVVNACFLGKLETRMQFLRT